MKSVSLFKLREPLLLPVILLEAETAKAGRNVRVARETEEGGNSE